MGSEVSYPSIEEIIEFNLLVLGLVKVKKADAHKVLSRQKIEAAINSCRGTEGSVYSKAAVLMHGLAQGHAFVSGNRRTAFIAAKDFVVRNGGRFLIPDDPNYAVVMRGIREGKYSDTEIAEWIEHGKIKRIER